LVERSLFRAVVAQSYPADLKLLAFCLSPQNGSIIGTNLEPQLEPLRMPEFASRTPRRLTLLFLRRWVLLLIWFEVRWNCGSGKPRMSLPWLSSYSSLIQAKLRAQPVDG
jgi:hypothetical protein